jgi:hypothetical protein
MKRVLALSLLVLALLLPPPLTLGQRDGGPLEVSLPQGGFAAFKIEVSPLSSPFSLKKQPGVLPPFVPQVVVGEGNALHRLLVDERGRFVFAYDLVITKLDSPKRFEVSARPLDRSFEQSLREQNPAAFQSAPGLSPPTFARATDQQTVADGETVALDLLINQPLGVKVVDYVTLASERSLLFPSRPSRPPRDFGVYNVELAIKEYQLSIDEQPVVTSGRRSCTGAVVWFYLPGRGRFIFSLVPHEGYDFRKVGVIADNKISFTWKGVKYEWVSQEPIVGSGGVWNLWVLNDQDYVDIFTPQADNNQAANTEKKVEASGGLIRRQVGPIVIPLPKNAQRSTLGTRGPATRSQSPETKNQSTERVHMVIGGARSIEALLPRK